MAKNDEKYAYLNRLSTEQLEELLHMDMEMAEPGNEDVSLKQSDSRSRRKKGAKTQPQGLREKTIWKRVST